MAATQPQQAPPPVAMGADVNAIVGALLRDLALAQTSQQKMFGFKRAAGAVLSLERPLTDLVLPDGSLEKIPGIGPASTRVIIEVLETGGSQTVEQAVAASDKVADIQRRRALRTNFLSRAEVLRVLNDKSLHGPTLNDYEGDLQMHSEWSDGYPTLDEIVDACIARGYSFAAVTDHSSGLRIAGGMSMQDAARQAELIHQINTRQSRASFRLFRGIEANIGSDGGLDLTDEQARSFEIVLAAPHSRLRLRENQTERLVRALRHPAVRILAHPRGRMSGSRAGIVADWNAVFEAAANEGVAVEIDGDPARQDLDYELADQAIEAGCIFALDSDAHTTAQLRYAETAIAHARLAAISPDRIVNCWPLERLEGWLENRSNLC